jgi:arylsulfatase A-like enzyme/Flp pilus assembly protein TadD
MKSFALSILGCLVALSAMAQTPHPPSAHKPAAPAAKSSAPQKPARPDVYLVTIDTLRADHVHAYGYDKIQTPAIDSVARDGVRFTAAFTASPITNTSHTSILTGLLPSVHGVTDFGIPLAPNHATWAELLKAEGYHTAAFIGAVILDSNSLSPGLNRGFDFYDNFPEQAGAASRWGRVERRGMDVVNHAESWLDQHRSGPHFIWVHLYDPHDPYEPPPPFSEQYKDRPYDGEIAYADSALAHFLAFLKQHGWYQNAIVIVVGDHGEGLGEHGEETHGIFLYDATTHVPLIVKPSGADSAGKTVDAQVRTIDLLPTVLDLLAVSAPDELNGQSLKPFFEWREKADRTAIGETDYPLRFGWAPLRSVREGGFKLIEAPRPELYDLKADPGETHNIYQPANPAVQKARSVLEQARDLPSADQARLPDPKDRIDEQNLLHTAMLATDENRDADARAALKKVLDLDPTSATALRQLGELELKAGNYPDAAGYLRRAREVRPEDSTAAFYEGQAREKTGDLAGARDALEASLKLVPGQLPARLLLGKVYLGLKDPKAAEDQFEAAQLIDSDDVEAQLGQAAARIAESNFADAVQQLEPLAKSQPHNAEVFRLLAQAYDGLGRKADADAARANAAALKPKS